MSVMVHNTASGGGSSVIIDGTEFKGTLELNATTNPPNNVSTLPYKFYYDLAVAYDNEIHILGDYLNDSLTAHYKWNGSSWTQISTSLPYDCSEGSSVVYKNEIHILGGFADPSTGHYKWNGSTWRSVSTIPYEFYRGSATVYDNGIHILGGQSNNVAHYKWDGSAWTSVSTLPYNFYRGSAVVYNNEIHILGSKNSSYRTSHYKWDGSAWTSVSTLPYVFYTSPAVVHNDEIHILGGDHDSGNIDDIPTRHYKWNDQSMSWKEEVYKLPYFFYCGSAVVYDDEIHILGTMHSKYTQSHYSLGHEILIEG